MKRCVACVMVLSLVLAGCASRLTKADYDRLHIGMQVDEAEKVLGVKLEDAKEVDYMGLTLTTGRFGPEDGPHIGVIIQEGEIRQLDAVDLE